MRYTRIEGAKIYNYIICGMLFILNVSPAWGANKLSEINFNNSNKSDAYGFFKANNSQFGSFVSGASGYAFRSSHAGDDGSGSNDYTHVTTTGENNNYWPATNKLYIKFYYKFESSYTNTSHNVKWLWTYGTDAHNELIIDSVSSNSVALKWQLSGGGAGWNDGKVTKYGSASVSKGSWMLVEIYMQLSSGANNLNADGIQWIKINGKYVINETGVKTGKPSRMSVPAINATANQPAGQGWWQIDEFEAWDGIPSSSGSTATNSTNNSQTPPPPGKPYVVN